MLFAVSCCNCRDEFFTFKKNNVLSTIVAYCTHKTHMIIKPEVTRIPCYMMIVRYGELEGSLATSPTTESRYYRYTA